MVFHKESHKRYMGPHGPPWDTSSFPTFWLLVHAEMLLFAPIPAGRDTLGQTQDTAKETIHNCVVRRLNMFKCGHIESLWNEAHSVDSRKPGSRQTDQVDVPDKSIQDAAKQGFVPHGLCPRRQVAIDSYYR